MAAQLLLVEHRDMIRAGLESFLADSDVRIVAQTPNGKDSVQLAREHKPTAVLLGTPRDEDALHALQRLKEKLPELPVIMFSIGDSLTFQARAMARGAHGSLTEGCSRRELLSTVENVAAGRAGWTEAQERRLRGSAVAPEGIEVPLTPREMQVLRQLAMGLPNREIAMMLAISNETVKEHVGSIFRKLGVSDRTKAAVWAIQKGLD